MTLGQLRTFLAVAAMGSVRAAAEQLVVTQPAVSSAMAALQRELGVALVEREGRGLRLTAAGEEFAGYARRSLALLEEARAAAAGRAEADRSRLRVAAVTTAGERIVPLAVRSFRSQFPEAEIVIEVGNRERVWDLLVHREVDLAVGGRPPTERGLTSLATRSHRLIVAAAAEQPSADAGLGNPAGAGWRAVNRNQLARATWLVREAGSGTRATTEEVFADLGLSPAILTLGSNSAIRESVQIGLGITLISADAVAGELESQVIEEWRYGPLPLQREWHLVARDGESLAPGARRFLHHLVDNGPSSERFHLTPEGLSFVAPAGRTR